METTALSMPEVAKCQEAVFSDATDPDDTVLNFHFIGDVPQPILVFSETGISFVSSSRRRMPTRWLTCRVLPRDLMRQMEKDLESRLDWIAVDHHNTAHAHTHIIVRGVLDDGRIHNIAGDYIAHCIRHRASELVTLELGHQSEMELQTKLRSEVEAERWTRHDKMLQTEQREQGIIDLRPGERARPILSARTAAS